ncbi:MAG: hypothetical protein HZA88_03945 [Verrucomicrobia bacterium]|nr:hypothetical protein [Verrucomicrobiota bacterium]
MPGEVEVEVEEPLRRMARSYHVTERKRKRDHWLNRGDGGNCLEGLSELDELSLKKLATKCNEKWKRDAQKAQGILRTKLVYKDGKTSTEKQKCRGRLSDTTEREP